MGGGGKKKHVFVLRFGFVLMMSEGEVIYREEGSAMH